MKPVPAQQKAVLVRPRGGFTLLEVLIVVVIAVIVAMFSVPAYKKSQDKNRYMAATGVLIDLANAARMVHAEYPNLNATANVSVNSSVSGDNCPQTPAEDLLGYLQCNKYLNAIPFTGRTYMGYSFTLNTQGQALCGNSCKPSGAMACMTGTNGISEYACAWVDKSGKLHNTSI